MDDLLSSHYGLGKATATQAGTAIESAVSNLRPGDALERISQCNSVARPCQDEQMQGARMRYIRSDMVNERNAAVGRQQMAVVEGV